VRALSIQQPWANTIAFGAKTVENRTWTAPRWIVGQTFAIHASKKPDISARPPAGESWPAEHRMHLGAVIAVATVAGCHHSSNASECPGPKCSPWAALGQYHWQFASVRPLPDPVPCKGMLGLWRLPEDVEKAVRAQLGEDGNHG
jgi:hypothetical protein